MKISICGPLSQDHVIESKVGPCTKNAHLVRFLFCASVTLSVLSWDQKKSSLGKGGLFEN